MITVSAIPILIKRNRSKYSICHLMIECQFDIIKSLDHNMDNIQGIVGGAIMADGKVGLILDIDGFFFFG